MKTSLNGARLGADKLSFLEYVDLAARHGFTGIDFGIGAALRAAEDLGGPHLVKDFLKEKGVEPAVWGLPFDWRGPNTVFEEGVAALTKQADFANLLGAERCVTWLPPSINGDLTDWNRHTMRRFGEIGSVLQDHGIRFGLEWVGPHHLRAGGANAMGTTPWLHTLDGVQNLIADIGLPNLGLLVDSYHCYTTGVTGDDLAALTDNDIVHVHINDAPAGVGPNDVRDGERVLPGAGDIDLVSFLSGLRRAGYTGFIAAEVLSPQPLADDPETAAARVRAALKTVSL
jgi:sugar phosphate isomerase/epimerase